MSHFLFSYVNVYGVSILQVGAVVAIGIQSSGFNSVDWVMIREIVTSWVLTVPFAALLAAGLLNLFKLAV
jgi:phosphate/sulfate permease